MGGRCRVEKEQISLVNLSEMGGSGHFAFTTPSHVTGISRLSVLSSVRQTFHLLLQVFYYILDTWIHNPSASYLSFCFQLSEIIE